MIVMIFKKQKQKLSPCQKPIHSICIIIICEKNDKLHLLSLNEWNKVVLTSKIFTLIKLVYYLLNIPEGFLIKNHAPLICI